MKTYSHAYTLAFEIESHHEEGTDLTSEQLVAALMRRIANIIENDEVLQALDCPYDTYEVTP